MPKLSTDVAAQVDQAEGGNFEPLAEGIYPAVLDGEVEVNEGPKGVYWKWTFKVSEGEYSGRKLFLNTGLSKDAQWRLNQVFKAFGVAADTDTDELIGRPVRLLVTQRIIQGGTRKGEMGNDIREVLSADGSSPAGAGAPASSGPGAAAGDDTPLF